MFQILEKIFTIHEHIFGGNLFEPLNFWLRIAAYQTFDSRQGSLHGILRLRSVHQFYGFYKRND